MVVSREAAGAILWGGLAVGVLDIGDAMGFQWLIGNNPVRVLYYIASGIVDREVARAGGFPVAALGLALHFFIAYTVTAVYVLASLRLPVLVRHAIPGSMAYGVAVNAVMRTIVLPLAGFQLPWASVSLSYANLIFAHLFCVGLPIGLTVRHFLANSPIHQPTNPPIHQLTNPPTHQSL
jgi:hypothetical protein